MKQVDYFTKLYQKVDYITEDLITEKKKSFYLNKPY